MSLPLLCSVTTFFVRLVRFMMIRSMLRNPVHFCRSSVIIIFVLGSVELTRSEGGMFWRCLGSVSFDGMDEKIVSLKSILSRYREI